VRVLEFARPRSSTLLGPVSKLNRDAGFIRELMGQGERQAEEFLSVLAFERAWRDKDVDAVLRVLSPDVELSSAPPFPAVDPVRGAEARAAAVDLCRTARMDLTHKQLTRERATWTVRSAGTDARGRVEAEVADGRVTRVRLGPAPT